MNKRRILFALTVAMSFLVIGIAIKTNAGDGDSGMGWSWGGGVESDGSIPFDDSNTNVGWISMNNKNCDVNDNGYVDSSEMPTHDDGDEIGSNWIDDNTRVAIGSDGYPVVAYGADNGGQAAIARCANKECTEMDTPVRLGVKGPSLAVTIGSDGFPVVVFPDSGWTSGASAANLVLVHCKDVSCSTFDYNVIAPRRNTIWGYSGQGTKPLSVTIGTNGFPVVAYTADINTYFGYTYYRNLAVIYCKNLTCTSKEKYDVHPVTMSGWGPKEIAIYNGNPVISYYAYTPSRAVWVAHCSTPSCSTVSSMTNMFSEGTNPIAYNDIAIGSDGKPILSFSDEISDDIEIVHCGGADCSDTANNTYTTIESTGDVGYLNAITIGPDGYPVVAYWKDTSVDEVKYVHCTDVKCTSFDAPVVVEANTGAGMGLDIAIGDDGSPLLVYWDVDDHMLHTAKCKDLGCSEVVMLGCDGKDDASTPSYNYGVNISKSSCISEECKVTGYVWSENVGWIDFNSPDNCMETDPPGEGKYQAASCTAPTGVSEGVVRNGDNLEGWARIVSIAEATVVTDGNAGGWTGWISMENPDGVSVDYGVTINSDNTFCKEGDPKTVDYGDGIRHCFAWSGGEDTVGPELGWIDFNLTNYVVPLSLKVCINSCDSGGTLIPDGGIYDLTFGEIRDLKACWNRNEDCNGPDDGDVTFDAGTAWNTPSFDPEDAITLADNLPSYKRMAALSVSQQSTENVTVSYAKNVMFTARVAPTVSCYTCDDATYTCSDPVDYQGVSCSLLGKYEALDDPNRPMNSCVPNCRPTPSGANWEEVAP